MKTDLLLSAILFAMAGGAQAQLNRGEAPPTVPGEGVEGWMRAPRIHMGTNDDRKPYQVVETCPAGTKAEVIDWPQPGDMICEPGDEAVPPPFGTQAPKIYMRVDPVSVPGSAPFREVTRCPRGTRLIVRGEGAETLFLCDRDYAVKWWGAEPSDTSGPHINIANNDPFRPYRPVSTCPPGRFPVIVDWPRPDDMGCAPF